MLLTFLRRISPVAFALAVLLAALLFVLRLYELPRQQHEASRWVDHTLEVLERAATLEADLATAASEVWRYATDRSPEGKERFGAAAARTSSDLSVLRSLTADNPVQQQALDRLAPLIEARIALQRAILQQAEWGDVEGPLRRTSMHDSPMLTDQILAVSEGIKVEEQRLLALRDLAAQSASLRTVVALVSCGVLVVGGGLLAVALVLGRRRERTHLAELRESHAQLEILNGVGTSFATELDHEHLVEAIVRAATRLTGAAYTALFQPIAPERNGGAEAWCLASLTGAPREAFTRFGLPRATRLFGLTFRAESVVRSDDILADPRYGSHGGMPPGHLPIRSYLAVPVVSRTGETLGGLLFGHPEPGRFGAREEGLVLGLAGQAAAALDNARLFQAVQDGKAEATALPLGRDHAPRRCEDRL